MAAAPGVCGDACTLGTAGVRGPVRSPSPLRHWAGTGSVSAARTSGTDYLPPRSDGEAPEDRDKESDGGNVLHVYRLDCPSTHGRYQVLCKSSL